MRTSSSQYYPVGTISGLLLTVHLWCNSMTSLVGQCFHKGKNPLKFSLEGCLWGTQNARSPWKSTGEWRRSLTQASHPLVVIKVIVPDYHFKASAEPKPVLGKTVKTNWTSQSYTQRLTLKMSLQAHLHVYQALLDSARPICKATSFGTLIRIKESCFLLCLPRSFYSDGVHPESLNYTL